MTTAKPKAPLSKDAQRRQASIDRQDQLREERQHFLDLLQSGQTRAQIAAQAGVSRSKVSRAAKRAEDERPAETVGAFTLKQIERLEKIIALADKKIEDGDLTAAYLTLKVLPQFERLHDLYRSCESGLFD